MKRIAALLLALVLMCGAGLAETDLSGYTDAQILELLDQVQQEIVSRHIEKTASLMGGEYVAGEDIPTGKYVFTCTYKGDWWANFSICADNGNGDQKKWEVITEDEGTYSTLIDLEKGDLLKCDEAFTLTVYAGVSFK